MKKLLITTDGFLPRWDGISSFLDELIPRISKDFKITVIAPDFGNLDKRYKAKIIRFPTIKIRLADNYYAALVNPFLMAKEIKKSHVVWSQALGPIGMLGIFLGKIYKKPVIYYNHMFEWEVYPKSQPVNLVKVPLNIITKIIAKIFYSMCDLIMVPSLESIELLNMMNIKNEKKVVHLAVDTKHYIPENKAIAKHKVGLDPRTFVVGYAGRVSYEKDLFTLYRAFMRLSKKYDDVLLLIAGGGHPNIEKKFKNKDKIILTGIKDDLLPYYQAMDVYVLPSLVETTSLTTMEAMACGLPVITTPVGFVKEYVQHGSNGFFFPKKNSYSLFKLLEYLKENSEIRHQVGIKARETIVENFSWEKTAQEIKKIINELIVKA